MFVISGYHITNILTQISPRNTFKALILLQQISKKTPPRQKEIPRQPPPPETIRLVKAYIKDSEHL